MGCAIRHESALRPQAIIRIRSEFKTMEHKIRSSKTLQLFWYKVLCTAHGLSRCYSPRTKEEILEYTTA